MASFSDLPPGAFFGFSVAGISVPCADQSGSPQYFSGGGVGPRHKQALSDLSTRAFVHIGVDFQHLFLLSSRCAQTGYNTRSGPDVRVGKPDA